MLIEIEERTLRTLLYSERDTGRRWMDVAEVAARQGDEPARVRSALEQLVRRYLATRSMLAGETHYAATGLGEAHVGNGARAAA